MPTNPIPLNKFRLIAKTLDSGSNLIYRENLEVASILLSAQITNTTSSIMSTDVKILKSGSLSDSDAITLLKNTKIPPGDSLNPISGKIVLEKYDAFIITSTESGSLQVILSILENAIN